MVDNHDRADWAETALVAFADECMSGQVYEETVIDLVCDLGHFCKIRLGLNDAEIVMLFQHGIGSWKAESDHPSGEPYENRKVFIDFVN